ncbi:MAG: hypothetical protein AAB554_05725 [Patescibacteria group bacterium]
MDDIECIPAPTAASQEVSAKTEIIDRGRSSSPKTKVIVALLLALALIGGVAFTLVKRLSSGEAASVATSVETGSGGSAETVVNAAVADAVPEGCLGADADPQRKWYCEEFLPFARKASADHGRIDRLEANAGHPRLPLSFWLIVMGIFSLTVFNTVLILPKKKGAAEK